MVEVNGYGLRAADPDLLAVTFAVARGEMTAEALAIWGLPAAGAGRGVIHPAPLTVFDDPVPGRMDKGGATVDPVAA